MKKIAILFPALLLIYVASLLFVYSLPDGNVIDNVAASKVNLSKEGLWPSVSTQFKNQTKLDNFTDITIMIPRATGSGQSLVYSMDMSDYARYWHGYQVFLRPLLMLFNYDQIRFGYGFLISLSLLWCCIAINSKLSFITAISLAVAMGLAHMEIFWQSMQFSNCFIITFLFIGYLLRHRNLSDFINERGTVTFFAVGSIINFIDLLTVPLVSLGLPLVLVVYSLNASSKEKVITTIRLSIAWAAGYGMTWFAKWCIASVILGRNVLSEALNQMFFRSIGDVSHPVNRIMMLTTNFDNMFMIHSIIYILPLPFIIALIMHKKINVGTTLSLSAIALSPYLWYMVLADHSQVHHWFTYRAQAVTVLCFLLISISIIRAMSKNKI